VVGLVGGWVLMGEWLLRWVWVLMGEWLLRWVGVGVDG